ncbi:MAG: heavy metal response regulator transcription factor [Paucibacter sp.]|nr:heavy metal response regulator transcription factor [Roseateles sp.]
MRILVVEDEPKTSAYLRKGLTEQGYVVDSAADGLDGLHLATTGNYDLVLLDVMLPGIDGWSVLQGVRQLHPAPILFLSALADVDDRVKGLRLGADDYLAKPFAFSELLARVQNILRRGPVQRETFLKVADVLLDPIKRRVTRAGDVVELTVKEYALLEYLMRHAGEMCSRTLIAENVWDMNFDSDTNVVDVAIRRLRAKIDDPYPLKLIHTVRGVGYVFEARTP